jgi:hypothetical protein
MEYQLYLVRKSIFLELKAESEKKYFRVFLAQKIRNFRFCNRKIPRNYSDQYLKLTKDFHVFGK